MKVGQYVKCIQTLGSAFTSGHCYPILGIKPTNGMALLPAENGDELWMYVVKVSQFEFVGDMETMPEPMFDLDDMELAEILMEEMKNA